VLGGFFFLDYYVKESGLNFEHVVLHQGKDTETLAIVGQSIAGDEMRIAPSSTVGSAALSEFLVEAIFLERSFSGGLGVICPTKTVCPLQKECRYGKKEERRVHERWHGCSC
jgi:hypothetical protein